MKTDSRVGTGRTDTRQAGQIVRYHTWATHRGQSIGEHSWQVLRILLTIWAGYRIPHEVVHHVTFHDVGEIAVGDPPYPIKRDNPDLKAIMDKLEEAALKEQGITLPPLDAFWKWRIKVAHTIEMLEYGLNEVMLGNMMGAPIVIQMKNWLADQLLITHRPLGLTDEEVDRINEYVNARLRRMEEAILLEGKVTNWILTRVRSHPPVSPSGERPGTPADGGQHASPEEIAGL